MKLRLLFLAAFAALVIGSLPAASLAQNEKLMLADILIALRSKKATLPERNEIIAKAIASRGITFTLTPEIEKELSDTGADKSVLDAIRQKTTVAKTVAPPPEVQPAKVEAPPEFSFYQKRADASLAKGENDAAIADYAKAIEMNPNWIGSYLGRGAALTAKGSPADAVKDYEKVIELKPDNAVAHYKRAELLEQKGDLDAAVAGYNKAFELDPANTAAKSASERILAERNKAAELAAAAAAKKAEDEKIPEFIQLGNLSKEQAVNIATPLYPEAASRANVSGIVVVEVVMDTDGKVISAKANSGSPLLRPNAETAALRSKFKPALFKGKPVKAKGVIAYNFAPKGRI